MISSLINNTFPIRSNKYKNVVIYTSGNINNVEKIADILEHERNINDKLKKLLLENKGCFSIIVDGGSYLFAAVDRVKGYPLYYTEGLDNNFLSNCSESILSRLPSSTLDQPAVLNFSMSGYVFGKDTLYREIKQVQAGEALFWDSKSPKPEIKRYYLYLPTPSENQPNERALINEFSEVIDNVTSSLIKEASGRPIWVPLSGGLDSRLILAKLAEHQCKDVFSFSYGVNGNHEMKQAASVAKALGVPWYKVASNARYGSDLYNSSLRKEYEKYSSGLVAIPSYAEFEAVTSLKDRKLISQDAIIVNGQTGDFVTGGHIPGFLFQDNPVVEQVFNYIIEKHCSLWCNLKDHGNINTILDMLNKGFSEIKQHSLSSSDSLSSLYECWEWQERQSKFVLQGQRLYDFFEFDWSLPLWYADVMDFWAKVPYHLKENQNLYIRYLKEYNYRDIYSLLRRSIQPWVLKYRWIPYAAKFIKLLRGDAKKERFYKRMDFYSTYHNQYSLVDRSLYRKHFRESRSPVSFFVMEFLKENGISDISI